jgi:hypothetical protein
MGGRYAHGGRCGILDLNAMALSVAEDAVLLIGDEK